MATIVELKPEKTTQNTISVCDIMKRNTSKIIQKTESQIPFYAQLFSDYYKEYLHTLNDVFGTCYIAEKEFLDKMGLDQKSIKIAEDFSDSLTKTYEFQLDMTNNYLKTFIQSRIAAMKSFDSYVHNMMDLYAKSLSLFNSTIKK